MNNWIKVEKNLITEIKGTTPEGIRYYLPQGQFPKSFEADDFDKNVRLAKGLMVPKPAQNGKNNMEKGNAPHYNEEPVYTVNVGGKQYFANKNGQPILINGEPYWCYGRDNFAGSKPRDQWIATKGAERGGRVAELPATRFALENYIRKRVKEQDFKTETEGNARTHEIVSTVFKNIFYETPDTLSRSNKVDGKETFQGNIRQVFRNNPFTSQDLEKNPSLLENLFITYNDNDSFGGEDTYKFVADSGKSYDISDVEDFKNRHPNWEEKGYIVLTGGSSDNSTSVAEAIEIEIDIVSQDYDAANVDDITKKVMGDEYGDNSKLRSDIYDNKIDKHPFNPNRNLTRKYNPSPELNVFIDKFLANNMQYVEKLDEEEKKNLDNTVAFLKTLNYREFADGWYVRRKNTTKVDRFGNTIKTDGKLEVMNPYGEVNISDRMSDEEKITAKKNAAMKNAVAYIFHELRMKLPDKSETKRENTPVENEEIKSYIKNLLTSDKYRGAIMQKYHVNDVILDKIVNDMFTGGANMKETLNNSRTVKGKKIYEDFGGDDFEFNLNPKKTRTAEPGEVLYDTEPERDESGTIITPPLDPNSKRLFAYDAKGDFVRTATPRKSVEEDGETKLRNQIEKWLSLNVADYTNIQHLKLEIQTQLLPQIPREAMTRIKDTILSIQKSEFPGIELPTAEIYK